MIDQVITFVTRRKLSIGGPLKVGGPGHVPSVPVGKDGPDSKTCLTGPALRAQSRNLGGRCLKRYRRKFEGDGKAWLSFFQRRVLLEMFDQKQSFHLT